MTEDNELDPLARLRAADPAAGVEPSAGFVEGVLASIPPVAPGAPVSDLASARSRRPVWRPLVAIAASIAIIGGAGFAIGTTSGAGTVLAGGAAAPITLGGSSSGNSAVGSGSAAGTAEKRVAPGAGASDSVSGYGFGRNSFTASGLSTAGGTAKAYGFDPRSASDATTVTALATALGLTAEPKRTDGGWVSGPQDGTAPSLTVGLDGTTSFYYSNPQLYPAPCVTTETGATSAPCEASSAALPAPDAAIAALRSLIAAAGRDPGAFEFSSETADGSLTRNAQAWPVVDGQRVDQSWTLESTTDGIVSASGFLAPIVGAGDYPVVSPQQAFERLSDPRFGAQQTAMPFAAATDRTGGGTATEPAPAAASPTDPPAAPTAGTPLSWPVHRVHIVSSRLGLASQWQPDGSVLVVPAYELTDSDGGTWSVIAVADAKLDFGTE